MSSITYEELTENPRDQLREPAARVMVQLSKLAAIAPASKVVDEELVVELNRRFGKLAFPAKVKKFGFGVGFAFGTPGQLKAEVLADQQAAIEAKLGMTIEDAETRANALFEYYLLTTPRSLRNRIANFDPNQARRQADAELASLQVLLNNLHGNTDLATRPMDGIYARQLAEINANLGQALRTGGFTGLPHAISGKDALSDFVDHLPTQRVATQLKAHYARNPQIQWKINHLRDIAALSVAIPYADAVVTDADVRAAAVNGTHLDKEFNTAIFSKLTDLANHLGH